MKCLVFLFIGFFQVSYSQGLVITELLADPTPSKGLPEVEFIEVYNTSTVSVQIADYQLEIGSSKPVLPSFVLKPLSYALICRSTNANQLKPYGDVISLSSFSINNEGAVITLTNKLKKTKQTINFNKTWYGGISPEGNSIEMIDPSMACKGKENWGGSKDKLGASPGKQNSINATLTDNNGPKLISYNAENDLLELVFDENLSSDFLLRNFKNEKIKSNVSSLINANVLAFRLMEKLALGDSIDLLLGGPEDCLGNVSEDLKVKILNIEGPSKGQILFSELLFEGDEFFELYNNSNRDVNLKNSILLVTNGKTSSKSNVSSTDLIIKKGQYAAFTKDGMVFSNYKQRYGANVIGWPKIPNLYSDNGTLKLLNVDSVLIDSIYYDVKMHAGNLFNTQNISLERSSFSKKYTLVSASKSFDYKTPGFKNSQAESNVIGNAFELKSKIFNPQKSEQATVLFSLDKSGGVCSADVYDRTGKHIKRILNNEILCTQGEFYWDGTTDSGILANVSYYMIKISLLNGGYKVEQSLSVVLAN